MKIRTEYTCPLELVHDMIKGKWKPIILWRLCLGATSLQSWKRISNKYTLVSDSDFTLLDEETGNQGI